MSSLSAKKVDSDDDDSGREASFAFGAEHRREVLLRRGICALSSYCYLHKTIANAFIRRALLKRGLRWFRYFKMYLKYVFQNVFD